MGGLALLSFMALLVNTVTQDRYPLRSGCGSEDAVVAQLKRGDRVEIQFALAGEKGTCYKVSVHSDGRILQGYVAAQGITGLDQFEQQRRSAPMLNSSPTPRGDEEVIRDSVLAGREDLGVKVSRLIQSNQPNEALRMLEEALRGNSKDAGLLSLAGYAAYRGDDLSRALEYWKESLALRPNPIVERLYRNAEREAAADNSGEKLFATRFMLRYDRQEIGADLARGIVAMLEEEFTRISSQLGCTVDERIVAIVQSPEAYRKATDAAEWSGGRFDGRIRVAIRDRQSLGQETRRLFSHEIVHACLASLGQWPAWLHEGLARKLSGESLSPADWAGLKELAHAGSLPRLNRLTQTWSRMSARHAGYAYAAALGAVDLFYLNYSGLGIRNLLSNPQMLPQITADLDRRLRE